MLLLASERRESERAACAVRVGLARGSQKRKEAESGTRRREASAWPESRGGAPRVAGGRDVRGRGRRRGVA